MESWKEKQERAAALIEVVKRDKASIQSAEDAQKLRGMVDEARALMAEAGRERADLEKARLDEILAEHDRQTTAVERERSAAESRRLQRPGVQPFQQERAPTKATLSERMRSDQIRLMASPRYIAALPELETAALAEGTNSAGGYLVVPAYMQELFAETRRQGNALRSYGWMNIHPVETNQVLIPKGTGAATVAIVSENTGKPSADQQYTQIAVNIFTAAGISKQSKQLAMDSTPTVLDLSTRELGTLMGNLEEQKAYSGSGSGEPRGVLNVTGLAIAPQTASDTANGAVASAATAQAIIDQILNGIVAVTTQYFAPPNGAMMHPRRLGFLLKAKDTATNYMFNVQGSFRAPNAEPALRSVTSMSTGIDTPPVSIFGLPIGTSVNIPTNANYGVSGGSDQDVIVVANWNELHWFQRQDVTLDTTDTAGTSWEQNQVWIRCEERWGSTAERYPTAFAVIHGKGLSASNV